MGISGRWPAWQGSSKSSASRTGCSPAAGGSGFTGIVIAYLSKFNPLMVLVVSFFFGRPNTGSLFRADSGVPPRLRR
jgi:ABC-type uncharacterized transport system permease subunit